MIIQNREKYENITMKYEFTIDKALIDYGAMKGMVTSKLYLDEYNDGDTGTENIITIAEDLCKSNICCIKAGMCDEIDQGVEALIEILHMNDVLVVFYSRGDLQVPKGVDWCTTFVDDYTIYGKGIQFEPWDETTIKGEFIVPYRHGEFKKEMLHPSVMTHPGNIWLYSDDNSVVPACETDCLDENNADCSRYVIENPEFRFMGEY